MFKLGCRVGAFGLIAVVALFLNAGPADAGCGCDKPPPPPAAIRPAFASPGGTVTLFGNEIRDGRRYRVRFRNSTTDASVSAVATRRRDIADGVLKTQLSVVVPPLPPGPASIHVSLDDDTVARISATYFTVLQAPITLDEANGETLATCYRAAIGADGRVYIPLNVGAIAERMIFSGVGEKYPLLFGADDIAIYNTQGYLMQLLGPEQAGIFAITDPGAPHSFELTYDRHEFVTYRAQHVDVGNLALDPADPAWHVDGTRHIDHDNLVIAIQGLVENQGAPSPGTTPPFDLSIVTALVGRESEPMSTHLIQWSTECGTR